MIPHLSIAPTAGFPKLAPAGARIIAALDEAAVHFGTVLTITSGSEPMGRAPTDPHPRGCAVDVGMAAVPADLIVALHARLRVHLGPAFTVLFEVPAGATLPAPLAAIAYRNPKATGWHLHIQPVKGTTWPPGVV